MTMGTRKLFHLVVAILLLVCLGALDAFTVTRHYRSTPKTTTTAPSSCAVVVVRDNTCLSLSTENANNHHQRIHESFSTSVAPIPQLLVAAVIAMAVAFHPDPVWADGSTKDFKLPPVDLKDRNRCVFTSSAMGQANAARDKLYDLRLCELSGKDATGFDLSGVIMSQTDVSKAKFVEAYFSKGYLRDSNFDEADFTNAIVDRANFKGSSVRGTVFKNAVLTGTSFEGANVENADFTDAYLGSFDIRNLCKNPTLKGQNPITGADTRESVGCS